MNVTAKLADCTKDILVEMAVDLKLYPNVTKARAVKAADLRMELAAAMALPQPEEIVDPVGLCPPEEQHAASPVVAELGLHNLHQTPLRTAETRALLNALETRVAAEHGLPDSLVVDDNPGSITQLHTTAGIDPRVAEIEALPVRNRHERRRRAALLRQARSRLST